MNVKLDATFWDEAYRSRNAAWSGEPNDRIVNGVEGLQPGRALDVGCGDGADAIWLAERGWQVTATDISSIALERGRANDRSGHIEWLQADILVWEPPPSIYDLVAAHFVHFASPEREMVFGRLAAAVRPHGVLLVVAHHPSDLQTTAGRWPMPDFYYTADDIAALLEPGDWEVVVAASCARSAVDPNGRTITVAVNRPTGSRTRSAVPAGSCRRMPACHCGYRSRSCALISSENIVAGLHRADHRATGDLLPSTLLTNASFLPATTA
jgi:SAM-dependent methyltransferase